MKGECQIRVRWDNSGGYFKAVSMDIANRQQASSTSSAERAVKVCAAKVLACREEEVMILGALRAGASITAIGNQWECINCARKGSATQLDLLPGGVS